MHMHCCAVVMRVVDLALNWERVVSDGDMTTLTASDHEAGCSSS